MSHPPPETGCAPAIRAVVFDLDGTLIESDAVKSSAYFDIFPPEVRPVVEAVRREDRYASRFAIIERVLRRWRGDAPQADIDRFAAAYNDICETHQRTCPERAGAPQILEKLSTRYPLYVCSGTFEEPLRRVVTARGWDRFFRAVFGGPRKKVENLRRVLEAGGYSGAELLVVGDTRDDLDAAGETGSRFAGVRSSSTDFPGSGVRMLADLRELEAMC